MSERVPYEDSLIWGLSETYFKQRGPAAWLSRELPFLISSNPQYASQLAWVVHAAVKAIEAKGHLSAGAPVTLLETGAGHGVFSLFFLTAFADVCQLEKTDYASRLDYLISDYSPRFVTEIAAHPFLQSPIAQGRVRVGRLDITRPRRWEDTSGQVHSLAPGSLCAIFANYVFDSLPQAVYRLADGRLSKKHLAVRQASGPPGRLPAHLFQIVDLLLVSYFEPQALEQVEPAWLANLLQLWLTEARSGLLPFSAPTFGALAALMSLLLPQGLLWIADKALVEPMPFSLPDFWPSLHGLASAHKVNFPLIRHYLMQELGLSCLHTPRSDQHLKTLVAQNAPTLELAVQESYRYHFITHNRNEQVFDQHERLSEQVLRGELNPLA